MFWEEFEKERQQVKVENKVKVQIVYPACQQNSLEYIGSSFMLITYHSVLFLQHSFGLNISQISFKKRGF